MSGSLKDQLIALGIAREKPKTRSKPKGKRRSGGDHKVKPAQVAANGEIDLDAAYRAREREEKQAAERKASAKRAEDLRRRQVNAEVAVLVEGKSLNDPDAELKRNFLYKGRIRSVLVTADQLPAVNAGDIGVVFLRGRYLLVPPEVREQVRALSAEHVPDLSGPDAGEDEGDYPVPDDLVW